MKQVMKAYSCPETHVALRLRTAVLQELQTVSVGGNISFDPTEGEHEAGD